MCINLLIIFISVYRYCHCYNLCAVYVQVMSLLLFRVLYMNMSLSLLESTCTDVRSL